VGLVQLGRLDEIVRRRRDRAERYQGLLAGISGVTPVTDPAYGTSNFQSFWIVLDETFPVGRDELLVRMSEAGVSARRGIMAAHLEPACADLERPALPVTEWLTARSLILPLFHELTDTEQEQVVDVIAEAGR
jgi:perosamine synthetase